MNLSVKYFDTLTKDIQKAIQLKDEDLVADKLKPYIETIVEADKQDIQQIFDCFCEQFGMDMLRKILDINRLLLIKTISLLLINVKNELWASYILSHPLMTQLISLEVGEQERDELTEYYISFLKSLSIRLNADQVSLFYNKKFCVFPLVYQALKYYNHNDNMVRTSVMNLTLGLMKIKQERLHRYFSSAPFSIYLVHFCCALNEQWRMLNVHLATDLSKHKLKMHISDQNDTLYYLYDMFQYGNAKTASNLKNCIVSYNILPQLMFSLISDKGISKKLSLYLISLLLKVFKDKDLYELIAVILFGKRLNSKIMKRIITSPYIPRSFSAHHQPVYYWDKFLYEITDNCQKLFEDIANFETDHEIAKNQGFSSNNQKQFLEEITNIGQYVKFDLLDLSQQVTKVEDCSWRNKEEQTEQNIIRTSVFQLLAQKDDSLIWIISNIILTIQKKQDIPNDVLMYCGLLMPRLDTINYLDQFNIKSITFIQNILFQQLAVQNKYRVSTVKNIIMIIEALVFRELQPKQQNILFNAYQNAINEVRLLIIPDNMIILIRHFEQEYKRWIFDTFSHQINIPFSVFSNPNESYPQIKEEEHYPINEKQSIKRAIIVFTQLKMLFDRYKHYIHKVPLSNWFEEDFNFKFSQTQNKWKLHKLYPIENRRVTECKIIKELKRKDLALIVEDDYSFVLVSPSNQNDNCYILLNVKYKHFEMEITKEDPKNAVIRWYLDSTTSKGQMKLSFANEILCISMMDKIKEKSKNAFEEEQAFILKFMLASLKQLKTLKK